MIEECSKYGGIVHINVDQYSPSGNINIKCPSIAIAMAAMNALNGRYFAGKRHFFYSFKTKLNLMFKIKKIKKTLIKEFA